MAVHTRINDWHQTIVHAAASFKEAIEQISSNSYQIGLVCSANRELLGVVTDGDIRRALLGGISLSENISFVMNRNPLVVNENISEESANDIMNLNHFFHLPVIGGGGRVCGLHVAEHLLKPKDLDETLVIMAGGKGKRLMPLTANTPKPMLALHGKPILEHIILKAKLDGFRNIFVSVNYLADIIIDYFGNGSKFGVNIEYLREDVPLGTAGALSLLPVETKENRLIVTNADILTGFSYSDMLSFCKKSAANGVMATRTQEWTNPFGVVETRNGILTGLIEKPTHQYQVNAGAYVLDSNMLDLLENNVYCDMTQLFFKSD